MTLTRLSIVVTAILLTTHSVLAEYRRVCYHTNWSQYRPGLGKFKPANIDPSLCTHLIYAFATIKNNQLATFEWNDEQLYQEFNALKAKNPSLKTLLAVGGWNQASTDFSPMVSSADTRATFVTTSITFLRTNGFDGLDLDWEYPSLRRGKDTDKANFATLCKELRQAYEEEARMSDKERLLVTAAVAAGKSNIDPAYDVPALAKYLDFISIMTYDFHGGSWEKSTGHNSPLFPRADEKGDQRRLNIDFAAHYWVSLGANKEQLNIGLATYGRGYTLVNSANHGMGAPATGPNPAGPYTREAGYLSYYEICDMMSKGGHTYRDSEQLVPYYVNGKTWIGYDDEQSISTKVTWLVQEGFGGAMVWALPLDDFNPMCGTSKRKFPLINRIKDDLIAAMAGVVPTTAAPVTTVAPATTAAPVTTAAPATTVAPVTTASPKTTAAPATTTAPVTTAAPVNMCAGKTDGYYQDPVKCDRYYRCMGGQVYIATQCENPDVTTWAPPATTAAPPATTAAPLATTPAQGPTASPGVFTCDGKPDGDYPDPTDCSKFKKCAGSRAFTFSCAPGTLYDIDIGICLWAFFAKCY